MNIAVIGGDGRMAEVARILRRDGANVTIYANDLVKELDRYTLKEAVEGADYVILPLPAESGGKLYTPHFSGEIGLQALADAMTPGQVVFAGKAETLRGLLKERGIELHDYFERETLTIKNAALTAEGALRVLMQEKDIAVSDMRVLVTGFGRIGKLTARKLAALGAEVTVSARKASDMAWIESLGYTPCLTERIAESICLYDAVINTVPAPVFDAEALNNLREGAVLIDLASEPGGVSPEKAAAAGVRLIRARSLPGRFTPKSAAQVICGTIYELISEREMEP